MLFTRSDSPTTGAPAATPAPTSFSSSCCRARPLGPTGRFCPVRDRTYRAGTLGAGRGARNFRRFRRPRHEPAGTVLPSRPPSRRQGLRPPEVRVPADNRGYRRSSAPDLSRARFLRSVMVIIEGPLQPPASLRAWTGLPHPDDRTGRRRRMHTATLPAPTRNRTGRL